MDKTLWAKRVMDRLHTGERDIDTALASLTKLLTEIQEAQNDLGVSAVATDPSISKVVDSIALLRDARSSLTAGHHRLEKLGKGLNIRMGWSTPGKVPTVTSDDEQVDVAQAV